MSIEQQALLGLGLDLLLGDPRWLPHPVRLIGKMALALEMPLRRMICSARKAGVAAALVVITASVLGAWGLTWGAGMWHPMAGDMASVLLIYLGLAARDMVEHSNKVHEALKSGSLPEARALVGMICGRDTNCLDQKEVVRATVESVAENIVDGVTAPLLYAVLAGPVGIMGYKAVSTLDSTFGYLNDRYREFGWASARLDDMLNFVPSRLTGLMVPAAAVLLGLRPLNAIRIFLRDRNKHPSPNAGQAEAAVAGAIGIQLGGKSWYSGKPSYKPLLGDPLEELHPRHILVANNLLLATTGLAAALFMGLRAVLAQP